MICEKIIKELESQERSIAWLGRRLNITRAYMHKMIHGKRNFHAKYKKEVAIALQVEYAEIFDA